MTDIFQTRPAEDFTDAEIKRFRQETAGTQNVVHLNNAGAGLMPDIVTKSVIDHISLESSIGGYEAAALRKENIQQFYIEAAKLLHCKSSNIAFTASATDAYTRALSSIPFAPGDTILTSTNDFISNQIQFLSCQKRFGVQIVRVNDRDTGEIDLNDLAEKLSRLRPKLLAITHIPTNSGLIQPVHDIGQIFHEYRRKHENKTWYILDACQSIGQLPLDVRNLHCDFLSVTARKFLRGPRGTGFLYVSDRALNEGLEPLFLDMRGAEWTSADSYQIREDAMRFEDWEFAYALVIGTGVAIAYCRAVGEERIQKRVQQHSHYMRCQLEDISGVRVLDEGKEKGGLVTFTVKGFEPLPIVQALAAQRINVVPSFRNFAVMDFDKKETTWALRASPHYYTTTDEIDIFVERLRSLIIS